MLTTSSDKATKLDDLLARPVRFSRLKKFDLSALHYAEGYTPDTSPIRKGSALHSFLLGSKDKVAIYTGGARNPKFEKYQAFMAENAGKHILIPSEMRDVDGMRRAIESNPVAMDLLDGIQEQTITWTYKGRRCMGTPDVVRIRNKRKRLTELKTDMSSQPYRFKRRGEWNGYHAQVSWYGDGLVRCLEHEPGPVDETFFVVVESTRPYPVTCIRVGDSMLKKGRKLWRPWFDTLLECERRRHFPPYAEGVIDWEDDEGDGLDWGLEDDAAE